MVTQVTREQTKINTTTSLNTELAGLSGPHLPVLATIRKPKEDKSTHCKINSLLSEYKELERFFYKYPNRVISNHVFEIREALQTSLAALNADAQKTIFSWRDRAIAAISSKFNKDLKYAEDRATLLRQFTTGTRSIEGNVRAVQLLKSIQELDGKIAPTLNFFVLKIAHEYKNLGVPIIDLYCEGQVGTLRAIDMFNVKRAYMLSTYAHHWIRQRITRALADQGRLIKVNRNMATYIRKVTKLRDELLDANPSLKDADLISTISLRLDIPTRTITTAFETSKKKYGLISLDRSNKLGHSMSDITPGNGEDDFEQMINTNNTREFLGKYLVRLNNREKTVLKLRYGLDPQNYGNPLTLTEVGAMLNLTRERIRQIQNGALKKLKSFIIDLDKNNPLLDS